MTTDTLTGVLSRIKWRSPEAGNDYVIAELATGETVKGLAPDTEFIIGSSYSFEGAWREGREWQGRKQKEFQFAKFVRSEPHSRIGLVYYLEKFCPGIGPTIASRIFDEFQQSAVKVLRSSPAEVAEKVQGLTLEVAQAASEELKKNVKFEETRIELTQLFMGKQFSRQLPAMVLKKWGVHAAARIKRDPFCLLVAGFPSCGFNRCDRMYVEQGKKLHKLKRLMLFIWHQVRESMDGHTWHQAKEIISKLRRDASVSDEGPEAMTSAEKRILRALELGVRSGWLAIKKTQDGIFVAEGQSAENEETIADVIVGLVEVSAAEQVEPMERLLEETELERLAIPDWAYEAPGAKQKPVPSAEERAAIGRRTGICQFCGRVLMKEESKRLGYGPICAMKNGLPYSADGSGDGDNDDGVSLSLLAEVGAES